MRGKKLECTTSTMISLNNRYREALSEILLLTERVVDDLILNGLRQNLGAIYKLNDSIAYLDMFCSFVTYISLSDNAVCPEMTEDGPIAISQGRHPIMEKISPNPFIPNNAFISPTNNFHIITGPNMSGKSTFLSQLCLIIIMSHIGTYVPADYASVRLVDQIFTRFGTSDSIESNASSFMQEMRDISYIVKKATNRSFVVIDELGRSTSNVAAIPICYAVSEHLMGVEAYTVFATHYDDLAKHLSEMYCQVRSHRFLVEKQGKESASSGSLRFLYRLEDGVESKVQHYGIETATMAGLPEVAIEKAYELKTVLVAEEEKRNQKKPSAYKNTHYFCERLLMLRNSTLSEEALRSYLQDLKDKFLLEE
eukprot:TRINITY_DN697_c0_g1_i7.p2 TRINITY_DN697_c0_g1~~TRINITY_DN697_c0_g1_i7.p2  ORF type:complete len:367 (-),score=47.58 TRINITY_DN697_c0_g1_i7:64-1164(-)